MKSFPWKRFFNFPKYWYYWCEAIGLLWKIFQTFASEFHNHLAIGFSTAPCSEFQRENSQVQTLGRVYRPSIARPSIALAKLDRPRSQRCVADFGHVTWNSITERIPGSFGSKSLGEEVRRLHFGRWFVKENAFSRSWRFVRVAINSRLFNSCSWWSMNAQKPTNFFHKTNV